MGRHVTKSIYVPGDPDGKGVVAIAFDAGDPEQRRLLDAISSLSSGDLRKLLGIEDWDTLLAVCKGRSKSEALRERLASRAGRNRELFESSAREGIRATPAGTEDPPARVRRHIKELVEPNVGGQWRILDPFAGTCNFPLVAVTSRSRSRAWYCESDPVARLWAQLKIDIASRSPEARGVLNAQLDELAARIPPLVTKAARKGFDTASPRIAAMNASLDALIGDLDGAAGDARLGDAMDTPLRETLLAARRIADELLDESPLLGRCLELACAAAGARASRSAARRSTARPTRRERELFGFAEHMAAALEDLKMEWLKGVDPASAPTLLCEDARDLAQFPRLGINVVITSLPAFTVADAVDPGTRVEHWMLRLADPSGRGRGLGAELRETLETLYDRPGSSRKGRDPRSLTAMELRAFIDDGVLPDDASYFPRGRGRWRTLSETLEQLRLRTSTLQDDHALFTRTGTALLRYVATVGDVFGALFEGRDDAGGVALLEVPNSQVRDLEIDVPAIVDEYLRSLGLEPLFNRSRHPRVIESSATAGGRSPHVRELRTELLAYRF